MAVEKMKIISLVGKLGDLDRVSRMVVMNGSVHMLNALSEINTNYFELEASEEHIQAMQEISDLKPYNVRKDFSREEEIIKAFHKIFDMEPRIEAKFLSDTHDYGDIVKDLMDKYDTIKHVSEEINEKNSQIGKLNNYIRNLSYIKSTDFVIDQLMELKYMKFKLILMSRDSFQKFKLNYENIPAIVFQLAEEIDNVIAAAFMPESLEDDAEKIFESLNYTLLELPLSYKGTAVNIIKQLEAEIEAQKSDIAALKKSVEEFKENYSDEIRKAYTLLELEKKQEHVKSEVAIGKNLFYMFGFVPENSIEQLNEYIKASLISDLIVITENISSKRSGHSPPTKLVNNALVKPFEALVAMYGIPCYNEMDPTPFFAISYMLLFGAMFGDLGQGLIILLGGLLLKKKSPASFFGDILTRLGASSMIFGLMYGSIFGNEHLIQGLWLKPMENINTMLISAIVLGVVFINIGYIYSLINLYQREDIEEGIFGREGVVGFLFFWVLLLTIWSKSTGAFDIPIIIPIIIMAVLLLAMVFKQPLANIVKGNKELYEEEPSEYYIEAGFGVIETLLSILSNVISFIRVGAFALNHVGLYIAFATMAEMINSSAVGFLVLILGNIIIIGLEGLIVFIQSLRLEYYELFSKYYTGYGIQYKPASLTNIDNDTEV